MAHRKSTASKARSSLSRQNSKKDFAVRQAAKKWHPKWSKDRSERVRDDLNRDVTALYDAMEKPSQTPLSVSQTDSVITLSEKKRFVGEKDGLEESDPTPAHRVAHSAGMSLEANSYNIYAARTLCS